ncbi:MAG: NCS2 family permease [Chloroflexi bacterium]|nr:NCS2 family permease [Chloroflexota bacterium]
MARQKRSGSTRQRRGEAAAPSRPVGPDTLLERLFKLTARGTDVATEVRAGLTTFMVMSYIIVVNAGIISTGAAIAGQNVTFSALVTSTCLVAGLMCAAMGLVANLPFAMAPGMGLNAVVAFQLMVGMQYSFSEAMGVIALEGIIITILVLTGLRQAIIRALPVPLKLAIGAGIGLFLFAIGAYEAGLFVVPLGATQGGTVPPPTAGALGNFLAPPTLYAVFGLVLTAVLMHQRVHGALLIGILLTTAVGIVVHLTLRVPLSVIPDKLQLPSQLISVPDLSNFGSGIVGLSFLGRGGANALLAGLLATLSIMLSDFFDTAGTFTALGTEAGLVDDNGNLRENEDKAYLIDSIGALAGGVFGSSSATTYIESGAGIAEGGRTGLTTVVVAIPFLLAMLLSPIFAVVPQEATAGALMIVGLLMMAATAAEIPWKNLAVGLPALFALMMMPLTWSITNGIGAGVILYTLLNARAAALPLWIVSAAFVVYFVIGTR